MVQALCDAEIYHVWACLCQYLLKLLAALLLLCQLRNLALKVVDDLKLALVQLCGIEALMGSTLVFGLIYSWL